VVGHAASPTCNVYVDVTVTPSKVKVKVTEYLNFRQLSKPYMLATMTAAPLRGFLVFLVVICYGLILRVQHATVCIAIVKIVVKMIALLDLNIRS